jgi:hypothetical protein
MLWIKFITQLLNISNKLKKHIGNEIGKQSEQGSNLQDKPKAWMM